MYTLPFHKEYKYKLDMVENFFQPTPNLELKNLHLYPVFDEDHFKLIKQISKYVGTKESNILLTCGSDAALELICKTFLKKDSTVLIVVPTYPHFFSFLNVPKENIKTVEVKDENEFFKIEPKGFNLCYFCLPNIPFGYTFQFKEVKKLVENNPSTLFIIDEAYFEYGNVNFISLTELFNNVIVTRTFSKFFGLAALRIGFLVYQNISVFDSTYNSKSVTLVAKKQAMIVLENIEHYKKEMESFIKTKNFLLKSLRELITQDAVCFKFNLKFGPFFCLWATKDIKKLFFQLNLKRRIIKNPSTKKTPNSIINKFCKISY